MSSFNKSDKTCRICCSCSQSEQLLEPCRCSGSLAHVHRQCLVRWISVSKSIVCNVCLTEYQCIRLTKTSPLFLCYLRHVKDRLDFSNLLTTVSLSVLFMLFVSAFAYLLFAGLSLRDKLYVMIVVLSILSTLITLHMITLTIDDYNRWLSRHTTVSIETIPSMTTNNGLKYQHIYTNFTQFPLK
jgi:hypothetical protein